MEVLSFEFPESLELDVLPGELVEMPQPVTTRVTATTTANNERFIRSPHRIFLIRKYYSAIFRRVGQGLVSVEWV